MSNIVFVGEHELCNGDCLDPYNYVQQEIDCVITDPPYGMGDAIDTRYGNKGRSRLWDTEREWDQITSEIEKFVVGLTNKYRAIIWGGNYYNLPPTNSWFIWDKKQKFSGSEAEMAWSNLGNPVRVFRMSRIDAYYNKARWKKAHPTEKPIALMKWCLEIATKEGDVVFDPFMGVGTTGVACVEMGRRFIGIEKDYRYFKIAHSRLKEVYSQTQLELPV